MTVEEHEIELPDGTVIPDWAWIITPDFVNVVVETDDEHFVCFRQTKYAVNGTTMAIVGGYIDDGEDPLTAAQREVGEETGYVSDDWIDLGPYAIDGNRGVGTAHLFFARNARLEAEMVADDLEEQELLLLDRSEITALLIAGEFKCVSWSAAVGLALLHAT